MVLTARRDGAREALIDAAAHLLIAEGYPAVTTRRLAQAAGVNHGLVHYYFGSVERVVIAAAEQATEQLIARQRALYAGDEPFIEKWRAAMQMLEDDLATGYPKLMFELSAMAWNHPEVRAVTADLNRRWRAVLTEAFAGAFDELGIEPDEARLRAAVSLAMTFQIGLFAERLEGVSDGHRELLATIDAWFESLASAPRKRGRRTRR